MEVSANLRSIQAKYLMSIFLTTGEEGVRAALGEEIMAMVEAKKYYDQ